MTLSYFAFLSAQTFVPQRDDDHVINNWKSKAKLDQSPRVWCILGRRHRSLSSPKSYADRCFSLALNLCSLAPASVLARSTVVASFRAGAASVRFLQASHLWSSCLKRAGVIGQRPKCSPHATCPPSLRQKIAVKKGCGPPARVSSDRG